MSICGKFLSFEEKIAIKEDVSLEQGIKEAIERPLGIISALEMLNNKREGEDAKGHIH